MPHIPRRLAPTLGPRPEPASSEERRPRAGPDPPTGKLSAGLGRLSPRTHQPDELRVIQTLFGTEARIDDDTGDLVLGQHFGGRRPR